MSGTEPTSALVDDVRARTGGNPFFVREVTQLLQSRGGLTESGSTLGIPDGVRQVVSQRLARLPQASVSILTIAAVAGRETAGDLLVRVTGMDAAAVAEHLEAPVRARMLVPPPGPAGPFRFAHDLFRETLYEAMTPVARARTHLRVARALQATATGALEPAAELAHHLLLAAAGGPVEVGLAEESAHYGVLAAEQASAGLAFEDAVGHAQRQLDGLGQAGLLREPIRLELLLCRADANRCAGDPAAARRDYNQVAEGARRLSLGTALGRAALGIHALGMESGASRSACVQLLDEALDLLDDQDSAVKARVLASLARELMLTGVSERIRATH